MGKLYVVGLGPGGQQYMSEKARAAVEEADVVIGYTTYIALVRDLFPEKEYVQTPMRTERERCMQAIERAGQGQCVALVCSGDAGIYGMAGLVLELLAAGKTDGVEVEIVPGITAAVMAASVLGAPLMNDFCIISLSDLLTPAAVIRKRLAAAAAGDFVICLYNPRSHTRTKPLDDALAILRSLLSPDTVVGIVRNAGRDGQSQWIGTLETVEPKQVDMFCVMIVGNSATRVLDGRMVTARGYEKTGGEKGYGRP